MKYLFIAFALLFSACSILPQPPTQSKLFTMKSKFMKFSDVCYVSSDSFSTTLEIYNAGQAVDRIKIGSHICNNDGCMSKAAFNKMFFSSSYPETILENIIQGKPIFSALHVKKNSNGFTQNIYKLHEYDIEYIVQNDEIYFKDKINNILIKLKDYSNEQ
ncbi:MAG: hypothetical protein U9N42_06715 [Campylobacterota bacterium]|nr:hypothetical protein [Campylobacterota bacterium]